MVEGWRGKRLAVKTRDGKSETYSKGRQLRAGRRALLGLLGTGAAGQESRADGGSNGIDTHGEEARLLSLATRRGRGKRKRKRQTRKRCLDKRQQAIDTVELRKREGKEESPRGQQE